MPSVGVMPVRERRPRAGSLEALMLLPAAALLALLAGAQADGPAPLAAPAVRELASPARGPWWVNLRWESDARRHAVLYREAGQGRHARWEVLDDIPALTYTVADLKPGTPYEFRVRAYPADARAKPVESASLTVTTGSETPRAWWGLQLGPLRRLPTPVAEADGVCAAVDHGNLYVLQTAGRKLWLSRVSLHAAPPKRPKPAPRAPAVSRALSAECTVEWTRDITPRTDDAPAWCFAPDICAADGKLWITWTAAQLQVAGAPGGRIRQRLVCYDLSGADAAAEGRLSAPLELQPSAPGRQTCGGSVAVFQGAVWVCWTETFADPSGERRAELHLGSYDPRQGQVAATMAWYDPQLAYTVLTTRWTRCPSARPRTPSLNPFEGELLVLFTDGCSRDDAPDAEPLLCARFDGRRLHGVQMLRGLGKNTCARGLEMAEGFYVVYCSDARYPAGAGSYQDVVLARLGPRGLDLTSTEIVDDMKCNTTPDLVALEDDLVAVCGKRDQPPFGVIGPPRLFGSYLSRLSLAPDAGGASGP